MQAGNQQMRPGHRQMQTDDRRSSSGNRLS
jgi:hypothetical protein